MILNYLASIVNDVIINLYSKGINFCQILIGLFIFNFILYEIRYIVRHFE